MVRLESNVKVYLGAGSRVAQTLPASRNGIPFVLLAGVVPRLWEGYREVGEWSGSEGGENKVPVVAHGHRAAVDAGGLEDDTKHWRSKARRCSRVFIVHLKCRNWGAESGVPLWYCPAHFVAHGQTLADLKNLVESIHSWELSTKKKYKNFNKKGKVINFRSCK